jgi:hypothetical protein
MNRHPSQARVPQCRRPLVFLVVLAVIGCENKTVGEITGTVTYQGQPLPTGTVSFWDSNNQCLASAPLFEGKYTAPVKVPVGAVKITVTTPGNSSGSRRTNMVRKNKRGEKISVIPIPAKYGNAEQSGLTYTVKPGANTYNIELQ